MYNRMSYLCLDRYTLYCLQKKTPNRALSGLSLAAWKCTAVVKLLSTAQFTKERHRRLPAELFLSHLFFLELQISAAAVNSRKIN